MSRIESESVRMGDLVDDLLLLAHLDQSRPLEQEPVDLLSLATDAVIDTQALQPDRAVALDANPGANPPVVIGDQARLRQILANLLTNARAHTPVTSPIDVEVQARDRNVEVSVRDAGPGMPPEVMAKVFDRFFRVDPALTRPRRHGTRPRHRQVPHRGPRRHRHLHQHRLQRQHVRDHPPPRTRSP